MSRSVLSHEVSRNEGCEPGEYCPTFDRFYRNEGNSRENLWIINQLQAREEDRKFFAGILAQKLYNEYRDILLSIRLRVAYTVTSLEKEMNMFLVAVSNGQIDEAVSAARRAQIKNKTAFGRNAADILSELEKLRRFESERGAGENSVKQMVTKMAYVFALLLGAASVLSIGEKYAKSEKSKAVRNEPNPMKNNPDKQFASDATSPLNSIYEEP